MTITRTQKMYFAIAILALFLLGLQATLAQEPPAGGAPPEAVAACSGITSGASCSFSGPQGESISGTCNTTPDDSFACMPSNAPGAPSSSNQSTSPSNETVTITSGNDAEISLLQQLLALLQQLLADLLGTSESTSVATTDDRPAGPPSHSHDHGPGGHSHDGPTGNQAGGPGSSSGQEFVGDDSETISGLSLPDSDFFGEYEIDDSEFGTEVEVTLSGDTRTILANALPNHITGTFPNSGNPNEISAQSNTYRFPATGDYTGEPVWVREPGVAVNGVKFEPETGEIVQCSSGESYKIEALQDEYDLGFDLNNAHVQPDGTYHYHGFPSELVELYDDGSDLVHLGFAEDGHMIYYDTTGTVEPSWQLKDDDREGASCTYRNNSVSIDGTAPDGTFVSDWEYDPATGNLDACNGAYIDGEYAYFVTDDYPFVSRCLQGEL